MEELNGIEGHVHAMASARQPKIHHGSNFRHLPSITDTPDYIMITQEILDAFKDRVVKSHKVNLKLNPVRSKSSRRAALSRRQIPPVSTDKSLLLYSKSRTSYDLHARHRPVKVFVDDITQLNKFPSSSGQELRELLKKKPAFQKDSSKISDQGNKRGMESGDEDGELPDKIIETVARANTMHVTHAPVLPEIRAAQCPIHVKQNTPRGGIDETAESFVGNSKDTRSNRKNREMHPIKCISIQQHNPSQSNTSRNRMDINVRIPEQFPTSKTPVLPKNMSSKDYVMTWLIHGSAPQGSNHFPEIIPSQMKTKSKPKYTPRKTYTDE